MAPLAMTLVKGNKTLLLVLAELAAPGNRLEGVKGAFLLR